MKSTLLKSIVSAVVIGATMAVTSVAAMAATTNYISSDYSTTFPKDTNTEHDFGNGLVINSNGYNADSKSFNEESFSGSLKLNAKDYTSVPASSSTNNGLFYTGKAGDTVSLVIKGNGIPFAVAVIGDGDPTYLINTVTEKAKLEEISYTLQSDTTICMFALKKTVNTVEYKQSIYIFKTSVTVPTKNTISTITSTGTVPTGDKYAKDATASYIIHEVSDAELAYTKLALGNGSSEAIANTATDKVYKTIQFPDGSAVTAPVGKYYYAVKVDKTTAPTAVSYTWVNVTE
ncbi:MAG: hypothetical protein IJ736_05300 [Firmicutes bacterium]|nr:hypothetical protein [Bacillota bacterium]